LAHRLQTYFPEVSISGWKYQDRENFYQKMIGKSSFAIIGNDAGAKQINQFYNYPLERIKTIPMPTPNYVYELTGDDKILSKNNIFKHQYLFYPAQFWPHKNHIRLLKALKILQQKNIKFDLVFTGSDKGNQEYIKQKTKEFGLENFVKFLGFVSKEEIIALYQNAFALTYSSMFGPDNIPPLEAMALNCPVICANYNGAQEQLKNCALFFDPLNENEIVDKIINLQNNSQLRNDLQDRGAKLAKQVNTKNYVESLIKILDEFQPIREMWSSDKEFVHL
jgi:glycosyltransferase involved in cell wall biosynthesis